MVIKVVKKNQEGERVFYKTSGMIITPQDKKGADSFDLFINKEIKALEKTLIKKGFISQGNIKKDPLAVWYTIGKQINKFLKMHSLKNEDKDYFFDSLYGRSSLINRSIPSNKIARNRNDFRIATILAQYDLKTLEKVGSWALWREIITCKNFFNDIRVQKWLIEKLISSFFTRDQARPFLKCVNNFLKKIDTLILNDNELSEELKEIYKSSHLKYPTKSSQNL